MKRGFRAFWKMIQQAQEKRAGNLLQSLSPISLMVLKTEGKKALEEIEKMEKVLESIKPSKN